MSPECTNKAKRSDGSVDAELLAGILHVSEADVAHSIGLSEASVATSFEDGSFEAQQQLKMLIELLERVVPWAGDPGMAFQWFCVQPIAGFGGMTAQQMVKAGRVSAVEAYLDRIADGGYA